MTDCRTDRRENEIATSILFYIDSLTDARHSILALQVYGIFTCQLRYGSAWKRLGWFRVPSTWIDQHRHQQSLYTARQTALKRH